MTGVQTCALPISGTDDVKVTVKPGDKVVTGKYAGQELKLDGEDYVIVKMANILAVVE